MADKLLPCPFCGGEAEITQDFVHGWKVMCVDWMNCIAHPSVQIYGEGSRKKVIEAWNNRTSHWHTGTPTEDGWYLCSTKASDFSVHYYDGNKWDFCPLDFVIKWQKIKED